MGSEKATALLFKSVHKAIKRNANELAHSQRSVVSVIDKFGLQSQIHTLMDQVTQDEPVFNGMVEIYASCEKNRGIVYLDTIKQSLLKHYDSRLLKSFILIQKQEDIPAMLDFAFQFKDLEEFDQIFFENFLNDFKDF